MQTSSNDTILALGLWEAKATILELILMNKCYFIQSCIADTVYVNRIEQWFLKCGPGTPRGPQLNYSLEPNELYNTNWGLRDRNAIGICSPLHIKLSVLEIKTVENHC